MMRRYNSEFSKPELKTTLNNLAFYFIFLLFDIWVISIGINKLNYIIISFATLLLIAIIGLCVYKYMKMPSHILLDDNCLTIHTRSNKIQIEIKQIKSIKELRKINTNLKFYHYFIGKGLFGYTGRLKSSRIGNYDAFIKNTSQQVYIKTLEKKYIVSCNNRIELINAIQKKLDPVKK